MKALTKPMGKKGKKSPVISTTCSVRVNQTLHKKAKFAAAANMRSINNQIEYWSQIGRIAEANPDLSFHAIQEMLVGIQAAEAGELEEFNLDEV